MSITRNLQCYSALGLTDKTKPTVCSVWQDCLPEF